jgi:hypothetical protein
MDVWLSGQRKLVEHWIGTTICSKGRSSWNHYASMLLLFITGLALFVSGTGHARAQSCSTPQSGTNTNTSWQFNSSVGNEVGTLGILMAPPPSANFSGKYIIGGGEICPYGQEFSVTGSMYSNGTFPANFNYEGNNPNCVSFSALVTITAPGCNNATGTWSNNNGIGSGTLSMSEPCFYPAGETTPIFAAWTTNMQSVYASFNEGPGLPVQIPIDYFNWGGRTVTETFPVSDPATDTCYYPDSIYPEHTQATAQAQAAPPYVLASYSGYSDNVGDPTNVATYYRQNGRLPCGWTSTQVMTIDCTYGGQPYSTETLEFLIGSSTIQAERSGISSPAQNWGPLPNAELLNDLNLLLLLN